MNTNVQLYKSNPRTQKARGCKHILSSFKTMGGFPTTSYLQNSFLFQLSSDLALDLKRVDQIGENLFKNNIMVRPAPMKPRHGFVDSQVVKTSDLRKHLRSTIRKMYQVGEAEGEIIMMKPISALASAVITPSRIVVGQSNDGATSGKDSIEIELKNQIPIEAFNKLFKITSDMEIEYPYVEVVQPLILKNEETQIVQLRNGPFLKTKFEVEEVTYKPTRIITVLSEDILEGDLIKWEEEILQAAKEIKKKGNIIETPVVYHPGGSIACHFGIHCHINNIPYVTTFKPVENEVFTIKKAKIGRPNTRSLIKGFKAGLSSHRGSVDYNVAKLYLYNAIAILHLFPSLDLSDPKSMRLMGYVWGKAMRIIAAFSCGEARHFSKKKQILDPLLQRGDRQTIYSEIWQSPFSSTLPLLVQSHEVFDLGSKAWGSGFGGKKWAGCTKALINVYDSIFKMFDNPTKTNINQIASNFNKMINKAHNNGWWLNKLIAQNSFKEIQNLPLMALTPSVVIDSQFAEETENFSLRRYRKIYKDAKTNVRNKLRKIYGSLKSKKIDTTPIMYNPGAKRYD